MDRYDVSLPVLRQALRVLEESGAVRISRGRGGGLEIGSPSQSSTFDRAVEFITRSNASQADIRELLLALLLVAMERSEEGRVGKEGGSTGEYRWAPYFKK